jgi:hypothetical protein
MLPWLLPLLQVEEESTAICRLSLDVGYDQMFKAILRRFLREFLELFFPSVAARLDFESMELVDKELFKGFPDGVPRFPDFVAKVKTREGKPEIVMVHVEAQTKTDPGFGRRMFEYYALLWLATDLPVLPLAPFVRKRAQEGIETAVYRHELFESEVMRFQYRSVALARLEGEEYLEKGALAAGLSAFMRFRRDTDPLELRARLLLRIVTSDLDDEAQFLLGNLIETRFRVPEAERDRYRRLVSRKEYRKVQDMELTWADEMRLEGFQEGLLRGKRETLKRLLASRFGPLSVRAESRIDALASVEELDSCFDRGLTAGSLEELGLEG